MSEDRSEVSKPTFSGFPLEKRLFKGIASLGLVHPTKVQIECIPVAVSGRDVLVSARTGSGKTLAYVIPMLQHVLSAKLKKEDVNDSIKAMVLLPTNELCEQVSGVIKSLLKFCGESVTMAVVTSDKATPMATQAHLLSEKPDIIVATPGRMFDHVNGKTVEFTKDFKLLILDEADLILSFDHEADIEAIVKCLPKHFQTMMLSATLDKEDVDSPLLLLRSKMLHNPAEVIIEDSNDGLIQYKVEVKSEDKFLVILALMKLGSLRGKILFFVSSIEMCYKLKLFFEQFSIRAAVLNAELPQNTRDNILSQFHRGVFEHLIATDASLEQPAQIVTKLSSSRKEIDVDNWLTGEETIQSDEASMDTPVKKPKSSFGVSRGIDFKFVSTIVNFDVPTSPNQYIHRVGRTARGGAKGIALTLATIEEMELLDSWSGYEEISIQPLSFRAADVNGFRYRVENALRLVTSLHIKEARLKELKYELLNSKKLATHFEDHPEERELLKHDKMLKPNSIQPCLASTPSYLLPSVNIPAMHVELKKRKFEEQRFIKNKFGKKPRGQPTPSNAPEDGAMDGSTAGRRIWKEKKYGRDRKFSKGKGNKRAPLV